MGRLKKLGQQAIGAGRGGPATKVHLVCDALGYPLCFRLSPANQSDITHAPALLDQAPFFETLAADRGYDSDALRELLGAQACEPAIPGRKSRLVPIAYDSHLFKARHLVENAFERLKEYRRLATRYEKTDRMFACLLTIGCFLFWLRF